MTHRNSAACSSLNPTASWPKTSGWLVANPLPLPGSSRELEPARKRAFVPAMSASIAMVPRVLSDLYWFGRYAERAEDLLRLLLATRTVAIETDLDVTHGRALEVLLQAVTHVSTTYPGFFKPRVEMMPEFRSMLLDRHRTGTAAHSLAALSAGRTRRTSSPRTSGWCWPTSSAPLPRSTDNLMTRAFS